jgi:hypothetical protein
MGIEKFIQSVCVETAVYWGNPQNDGYGHYTFDTAVEIDVRWDEKTEVITDDEGREVVSKAKILVTQDVDYEGYLYKGSLSDLTAAQKSDPRLVDGAYQIRRFDKTSMIKKTDEFVRMAYI